MIPNMSTFTDDNITIKLTIPVTFTYYNNLPKSVHVTSKSSQKMLFYCLIYSMEFCIGTTSIYTQSFHIFF